MTAGVLQGVPVTTLDTDLWVALPDDSLVNFLCRVDGLASFGTEYRRACELDRLGIRCGCSPWDG